MFFSADQIQYYNVIHTALGYSACIMKFPLHSLLFVVLVFCLLPRVCYSLTGAYSGVYFG